LAARRAGTVRPRPARQAEGRGLAAGGEEEAGAAAEGRCLMLARAAKWLRVLFCLTVVPAGFALLGGAAASDASGEAAARR
jgi:hypothetical protein